MSASAFQKWLNELDQVAFSNFTDQVLWLITAIAILVVWIFCLALGWVDRLNASMAFLAMWLGYLTGSSLITGARDAQKCATRADYEKKKVELELAKSETEQAKATQITKEQPVVQPEPGGGI